jgi:CMP-N,N'-diacetyllegionaminic acid synthase
MIWPILVIVPARGGSKRLPGKNLKPLQGETLLERTASFLQAEGFLSAAVLSTDDESIANEGRRVGLQVPFLRPTELASDTASTSAVILHALDTLANDRGSDPELIAVLQVTSPFRRSNLLNDAIQLLSANASANSVVAMSRLHVPASFVFVQDQSGFAQHATELLAPALVPTGSMYLARTASFRATGTLYATPTIPLTVDQLDAIDIDTAEDLWLAETIASERARRCGAPPSDVPPQLEGSS